MYLYKYLFKGPDYTSFHIASSQMGTEKETDEFKDYINGRYLSSSEAVWRILNFHITQQTPAVKALRVHLPEQQLYQMPRKNAMESEGSQLLRYFCRPLDSTFNNLLYCDYFAQYILYPQSSTQPIQQGSIWIEDYNNPDIQNNYIIPMVVKRRVTGNIICRLRTVPTRVGELFYLRILLLHKYARSFKELKQVGENEYTTFQEAAIALGLFDNHNEAFYAMEEGVHLFYRPAQLRFLFANLLFDIPFPAIDLWNRFRDALCADCQQTPVQPVNYSLGLEYIEHILYSRGGNLASFGLPLPQQAPTTELEYENFLLESQATVALQQVTQKKECLTIEQHAIFDQIIESTKSSNLLRPRIFFVDGRAGRGKTFLLDTIIQQLRSERQIIVIVGTTALSVTLYERGRTAHSMFGIPITEVSI